MFSKLWLHRRVKLNYDEVITSFHLEVISGDEKRQRGPGGTEPGSKRGHLGLQDAKGAAVAKSVTSLTALPQYLPPGEPQHLKD